MANTHRSKKSGRYTGTRVLDPVQAAGQYYDEHKKSLDKIIRDPMGVGKKKIFVDSFKYGINGGYGITGKTNTKKRFLEKVEYVKAHLRGYNLDALEAKRTAYGGEYYGFKDKRKMTMKKFDLRQQIKDHYWDNGLDEDDPNYQWIDGYFEIQGSNTVIARVYQNNEFAEGESPLAHYEYFDRSEIGL